MSYVKIVNSNKLKISEIYSSLIRYLISLFLKFNQNIPYKRWKRSEKLIIYFHNIPFLMSQLKLRDSNSINVEIYNNYIEIINNNPVDISNSFISIASLDNIDQNKAISKKLTLYLKKYESLQINLITNLNCVLFLIIACEIKNVNNHNIFEDLIFYDNENKVYKFKYSINQIYNLIDFKVNKKSIRFNFITSDEGISLIFNGILFSLNNLYKEYNSENYLKFVLVPAINAISYLMHSNNKKYKKEIIKTILDVDEYVISEIKKHRIQIQKESQNILSEIVIDNILDIKKTNVKNKNKISVREKYIFENIDIDEIWNLIYKNINVYNINPVFIILYFVINDKYSKLKNFIQEFYFNKDFISKSLNKISKQEIYEIIYLQFKGCIDIKKIIGNDLYNAYLETIKNNIINIKKIYSYFTNLFYKFKITDLELETIQNIIVNNTNKYTRQNEENIDINIMNLDLLKILNLNKYQFNSLIKMKNQTKFILSLEQGMGKTRTIISEILYLNKYFNYNNFIAIIPATYIYVWETEILKVKNILNIDMPNITIVSLEQYRLKSLDFLINKCFKDKFDLFKISNIYLCIDESIVIKNQDSKNYKCCKKIASLMEIIKILNPNFNYRIRMTTGTIQSESINDWKYISSFLFNLKENTINLDTIVNSLIKNNSDFDKSDSIKEELMKFRSIGDMIMIQRRQELNINVVKKSIEIDFWKNNPFNGIIQFFNSIKQNLNLHMSGISDLIGKSKDLLEDNNNIDENNFNNLNKSLRCNKVNDLIKDLNINKSNINFDLDNTLIEKYKNYKMKFLWTLRELAEIIMPFKIYGFFYNLDAGIISNKIIPKTIIDNFIFEKFYSGYKNPHFIGMNIINEYKNLEIKNLESNYNKESNNTTTNILEKLYDYTSNINNRIEETIDIYKKSTEELEKDLFRINCVLYYIIESTWKNKYKDYSIEKIKKLIYDKINLSNIQGLSCYFKSNFEIELSSNSVLLIEKFLDNEFPNGVLYYSMKFDEICKSILYEIQHNHTILIFFELKSHIQLFKEFISDKFYYNILELDSKIKNRDQIINKMNNRECNILCTTYSLAARGFSFNNTNTIIFFMPTSQYDLYTQAKYRNNRLDSKLDTIYHYDFKYDVFSINNKLYNMYIKKEITKNLIENILVMPYENLMILYNVLDKSNTYYFSYLYNETSKFIKSNEITKKEYIDGLMNMQNN